MQTQAHVQIENPVMQFVRAAISKMARPSRWRRSRELRICENISLGNRNFLAVVGYQEQRFLIAGTPSAISLLADVTEGTARCDESAFDRGDEGDTAGK